MSTHAAEKPGHQRNVSSATLTPTVGTNHVTVTVPNTNPAPNTIAKYTAEDLRTSTDAFESRLAT
jgi:hypothetical protein